MVLSFISADLNKGTSNALQSRYFVWIQLSKSMIGKCLSFHSCAAQAFKTATEARADEMLMRSVEEYFNSGCVDDKSKVRSTPLPAIYFQHPGMISMPRNSRC